MTMRMTLRLMMPPLVAAVTAETITMTAAVTAVWIDENENATRRKNGGGTTRRATNVIDGMIAVVFHPRTMINIIIIDDEKRMKKRKRSARRNIMTAMMRMTLEVDEEVSLLARNSNFMLRKPKKIWLKKRLEKNCYNS